MFYNSRPSPDTHAATSNVTGLKRLHKDISDNITLSQVRITKARYKENKNGPQLKEGDRVYLLIKNLKTRKRSKKLDYIKVGPFLITEQKSEVSYRLQLPQNARIHPVFYISLLEPADPTIPL